VHFFRRAGSSGPRSGIAPTVALIARDELLVRRVRDALEHAAIDLIDWAPDVRSLADGSGASTIVVVGGGTTVECRAAIRAAGSRFPGVHVVVLASLSTAGVHKVLDAGAAGLLEASEIETALAATVLAVDAGQVVVPRRSRRNAIRPALSHRERQILALVAEGLTNCQIGAQLFLAESTVKTHLSSIFGKLGVDSRNEATELVLDPDLKLGLELPRISVLD
jgi:DNA-binding NarL/FixJ family response regulator